MHLSIARVLGASMPELFEEVQSKEQAAKRRGNPNRRAVKLQKAFEQLKPVEQQLILKQMAGLLARK